MSALDELEAIAHVFDREGRHTASSRTQAAKSALALLAEKASTVEVLIHAAIGDGLLDRAYLTYTNELRAAIVAAVGAPK